MGEIYTTRRERLRQFMREDCDGSQRSLCELIEKAPSTVSRIFTGKKNVGEELARELEVKMGKPPYWLDGFTGADSGPRWPFRNIDPQRIETLSVDSREALEQTLLSALKLFESATQKSSKKTAS